MPGGSTCPEQNFTTALNRIGLNDHAINEAKDRDASGSSMDSHALADSSSSNDNTPMSNIKIEQASHQSPMQGNKPLNSMLQPRIYQKQEKMLDKNGQKISQVQQMLQRKKGIDIMDADELFHLLVNPFYDVWKEKRTKYIKFDQLQKMKNARRFYRPAPNFLAKNMENLGQQSTSQNREKDIVDDQQKGRDKYLTKEVRTFDEVYKSIKSKVNDFEQRRATKQTRNCTSKNKTQEKAKSDNEYDDEDGDGDGDDQEDELMPLNDEYGNEEDFEDFDEDALDDQDIGGGDREILDNRILGIIDVFQNINKQSQISQKQMKLLQDLGNKNLSIEKRKELSSDQNQEGGEKKQKLYGSRDNLEQKPITSNAQGGFTYIHPNNSNPQLAFGSMAPRKPPSQIVKKKRNMVNQNNDQMLFGIGQHQLVTVKQQVGVQPTVVTPACNVYNIGGASGIQVTHTVHRAAHQAPNNSKKRMASTSFQIKDEISGKRYEKFDKTDSKNVNSIIPQTMVEKCFQNHKYRMALDKPLLDMKLEINGQQAQNNNYNQTQAAGFKNPIIQNIGNVGSLQYMQKNAKKGDKQNLEQQHYYVVEQAGDIRMNKQQISNQKRNKLGQELIQTNNNRFQNRIVDDSDANTGQFLNIHEERQMYQVTQKRIHSADKYSNQKNNLNSGFKIKEFNETSYPMIISSQGNKKNKKNGNMTEFDELKQLSITDQTNPLFIYQTEHKDRFIQKQVLEQSGSQNVSKQDFRQNPQVTSNDPLVDPDNNKFIIKKHVSHKKNLNNRASNIYSNMVQFEGRDQPEYIANQINKSSISSNGGGSLMNSFNSRMAQIADENKNNVFNYQNKNIYNSNLQGDRSQKAGNPSSGHSDLVDLMKIYPKKDKINDNQGRTKIKSFGQSPHQHTRGNDVTHSKDPQANIITWNGHIIKAIQQNENKNKNTTDYSNYIGPESTHNQRGSSQIYADFDGQNNQNMSKFMRSDPQNLKDGKKRAIKRVTMTETKRRQLGGSSRQQQQKQLQYVQPKKKGRQINTATITSSTFHPGPRTQNNHYATNGINMEQMVVQANQEQQNFINGLFQHQEQLQKDLQKQLTASKKQKQRENDNSAAAIANIMSYKDNALQTELTLDQNNRELHTSSSKHRSQHPQAIYILNTNNYRSNPNSIRKVSKFNSGLIDMEKYNSMQGKTSMFTNHDVQRNQQLISPNRPILIHPLSGAQTSQVKSMKRSSASQSILQSIEHQGHSQKNSMKSTSNVYVA